MRAGEVSRGFPSLQRSAHQARIGGTYPEMCKEKAEQFSELTQGWQEFTCVKGRRNLEMLGLWAECSEGNCLSHEPNSALD